MSHTLLSRLTLATWRRDPYHALSRGLLTYALNRLCKRCEGIRDALRSSVLNSVRANLFSCSPLEVYFRYNLCILRHTNARRAVERLREKAIRVEEKADRRSLRNGDVNFSSLQFVLPAGRRSSKRGQRVFDAC